MVFQPWKKSFIGLTPAPKKDKVRVFNCWITVMLPNYEGTIIHQLVKKGYTVGADIAKNDVNQHNYLSHLIIVSVYQLSRPHLTATQVCMDVAEIMGEMKLLFYSIIISMGDDAAWARSNIVVSQPKNLLNSPLPDDGKFKLN